MPRDEAPRDTRLPPWVYLTTAKGVRGHGLVSNVTKHQVGWGLGTGNWEPGTGNWEEPGTWNWELGTDNYVWGWEGLPLSGSWPVRFGDE